jgi:hypothetical protein
MNMEIGTEADNSQKKEYINGIFMLCVLVQAGVPGNVHCAADDGADQQQPQALARHQAARSQHLQGPGTCLLI